VWDQTYLDEIRYADYGAASDHSFLVRIKLHYDNRPDPFSAYRSGFEIRTVRRCKRIEIWTHAGSPRLVRTYHLNYLDELEGSSDRLPHNGVSLLARFEVEGHDASAGTSEQLPPLDLGYAIFEPGKRRFEAIRGTELPVVSAANRNYELVDLFGSGL